MFNNPLLQRYRFSQLRPKQIGIYGFIYVAIVSIILLSNYTIFTTLKPLLFGQVELPFTLSQAVFYQFLGLQVIILWVWASYNSGTSLTREILNKSYFFFKLLPITALQKAFGVLLGTNLIAYTFAGLNVVMLVLFAYLGKIKPIRFSYYLLGIVAIAGVLNTLTLLLSINPNAKSRRRFGTLIIIGGAIWMIMTIMGILFASGRVRARNVEDIVVDFFSLKLPGIPLFSLMLFYFTGWILIGIMRKFRYERESLFTPLGSLLFTLSFEVMTTGVFWSYLPLKSSLYGHRILCFWILLLINMGTLKHVGRYFEAIRRIRERSTSTLLILLRFFRHTTLCWGICLFGIWTAFFVGLSSMTSLSVSEMLFPLVNLFSFYLFFMVLLEFFVLYRHLHLSIKVFLIFIAVFAVFFPMSLSRVLEDRLVYLHSVMGYMANLITPFLLQIGNAAVQWRVFLINLVGCLVPFTVIVRKYLSFVKLRERM